MELYSKEELLQKIKEEYPCGGECDRCLAFVDDGRCTPLHSIRKIIDDLKPVIIVDRELSINGERPLPLIVSDIIKDSEKASTRGEWIIDGHHYKCSRCGKTLAIMFSETDDDDLIGCPFCLSKMKGSADND